MSIGAGTAFAAEGTLRNVIFGRIETAAAEFIAGSGIRRLDETVAENIKLPGNRPMS
ncbi:hypothetical protein [Rudaea sp.]|uniref:hypothetical protein n=1 Tax=Rudaea sp. TaxID=2136325 RepID=UPI002ED48539